MMELNDPAYSKVHSMARNAFAHIMNGVGYGRCDFRIDEKGDVYFLEINANCGMYYDPNSLPQGDYADRMVTAEKSRDGYLYDDFIATQVQTCLKTQAVRSPWYCISHDAHGHFTTRSSRNVTEGTPLFSDPNYPIPVISKALYTLGEDDATVGCVICRGDGINSVVAIRHSCEPNMQFVHGRTLTFEASRDINKGEELTVDYGTLRDPKMPAFACSCGTTSCRSVVFSDQPTPRISQQRRKWERRERLLHMRQQKASKRQAKLSPEEEELLASAKAKISPAGSLHIQQSLNLGEEGEDEENAVDSSLESLGESMEELELLEEVKGLLSDAEVATAEVSLDGTAEPAAQAKESSSAVAQPPTASPGPPATQPVSAAAPAAVATPPATPAAAPHHEEKKRRGYKLQPDSLPSHK
eukprot:GILJ01028120.1.p1 GENE.GILJ01028120.1~~GILJ01028120.1.p1  ORF type:complete len:459 (+),score=70.39 GILJ01028120.1:139-1377(+)